LADTEYWFARYRPGLPQNASRGLVALNWKGRAAIAAFVLGLVLGGLSALFFGLRDQFAIGIPLFIVLAIAGGSFFLWASVAKTDPVKPAADYLAERRK
jgi:hypothetical protein